jgi:hypothetical protein
VGVQRGAVAATQQGVDARGYRVSTASVSPEDLADLETTGLETYDWLGADPRWQDAHMAGSWLVERPGWHASVVKG